MYCNNCGESISEDATFCRHCGYPTETHIKPATSNKRLLNWFIDLIGVTVFAFILGFTLAIFGLADFIDSTPEQVLGFIFSFIYYLLFESLTHKTLGKLLTRTRVVDSEGGTPEFRQIFIRSLVRFVPFEAFSFFSNKGVDGKHRPIGWHDKWAGTMVIDETEI